MIVRLSGDPDLGAFNAVNEALTIAQSDGNLDVWIDLQGLEFIDSTGIRLLLDAHQRAESDGHALRIVRADARVQRVFALTDLVWIA